MNNKRGGHHSGDDLNGIGGMNTDLGDPIYSIADGLVLYAGEPSSGWGKTLVIGHRTRDGRLLHSMYAHLERIEVSLGSLVARGQLIGTNGTANDHYPAHLHFELRESDHVDIRGGYLHEKLNLPDPVAVLSELRGAAENDHSPAALSLVMKQWKPTWNSLEIEGAEHFLKMQSGD
jgi:murein DD-endopeptidase MepM/ murein hydrolase activator NlpD